MRNHNKPRSGDNGIMFFSVKKVGLTVAYTSHSDGIAYGFAWKADGDQANAVIARKIAMSRLMGKGMVEIPNLEPGKERNAIIRAIDNMFVNGLLDGVAGTSLRERWESSMESGPNYCAFIANLCD